MYVRDAKNREEVWLLDNIEAMGLDETAFRSRDYVIAIDEESGEKAGFGRIRIHKPDDAPEICELTSIGVVKAWREQGVGAHVIERLIDKAGDDGFEAVYALVGVPDFLAQFGFEAIEVDDLPGKLRERLGAKRERTEPDAIPMMLSVGEFEMPDRLRERFKSARPQETTPSDTDDADDMAEEFGIDPDEATYKYDTGRQ
ncbi:GNAT family N-acetyltransferase [Haladaptatus caseinilyticus]|uniref:GNAT family N-acetyltransferase n=1 Tax=Haladaptatus caseinilyticus TaxID=2993314 RepID=UPI00224AF33B|nr:GNAT family N-acetyltransferase [Haladaptatus caseinilyticus]